MVNGDSTTRWARCWHVQSDVSELCSGKETSGLNNGHGVEVQGHWNKQDWVLMHLSVHKTEKLYLTLH